MKIWLDDKRKAPPGWTHVFEPETVIETIRAGDVEEISLDHDLGIFRNGREIGGYDVLLWIEREVWTDPDFWPPAIHVHSANPPARRRMEMAILAIAKASIERGTR